MKHLFIAVLLVACSGTPPPSPALAAPRAFHVEIAGRGPAVILIPGLSSSGAVWNDTVEHLRTRYTCHVITLAGFAGVPPIDAPLLATASQQLIDYITKHRLGRPVVVGHSLGGTLALDLAAAAPAAVGAVVIVDMLPFMARVFFDVAAVDDAKPMIARMRAGLAAQTDQQYAEQARSGPWIRNMVTSPAHLQQITGWTLASDRSTVAAAMLDMLEVDRRPLLAQIDAPVLVLAAGLRGTGQHVDRARHAAMFEQQYAGLRKLHFAMSDTARHFIM